MIDFTLIVDQQEKEFVEYIKVYRAINGMANAEIFSEAVKTFPISPNIDDRRGEKRR